MKTVVKIDNIKQLLCYFGGHFGQSLKQQLYTRFIRISHCLSRRSLGQTCFILPDVYYLGKIWHQVFL
jgi:hypothetical protein